MRRGRRESRTVRARKAYPTRCPGGSRRAPPTRATLRCAISTKVLLISSPVICQPPNFAEFDREVAGSGRHFENGRFRGEQGGDAAGIGPEGFHRLAGVPGVPLRHPTFHTRASVRFHCGAHASSLHILIAYLISYLKTMLYWLAMSRSNRTDLT